MKRKNRFIAAILITLLATVSVKAQTPTEYSSMIDINGLKLGYKYTLAQITEKLGTITKTEYYGEGEAKITEYCFGNDFVAKNEEAGVYRVRLKTNKYSLLNGKLRVGNPISSIDAITNKETKQILSNCIRIYIDRSDVDYVQIFYENGKIVSLFVDVHAF